MGFPRAYYSKAPRSRPEPRLARVLLPVFFPQTTIRQCLDQRRGIIVSHDMEAVDDLIRGRSPDAVQPPGRISRVVPGRAFQVIHTWERPGNGYPKHGDWSG